MAVVRVPVHVTALYSTQTTTLDGVPYLLTFRYNTREQAYYLSIESVDQSVTYAQGVKVVANYGLLRPFAQPPGELYAWTSDNDDSPPKLGDLADGARAGLFYVEAANLYASGLDPERNPNPGA